MATIFTTNLRLALGNSFYFNLSYMSCLGWLEPQTKWWILINWVVVTQPFDDPVFASPHLNSLVYWAEYAECSYSQRYISLELWVSFLQVVGYFTTSLELRAMITRVDLISFLQIHSFKLCLLPSLHISAFWEKTNYIGHNQPLNFNNRDLKIVFEWSVVTLSLGPSKILRHVGN